MIPYPKIPIFMFGLDRKIPGIPQSRGSGSGIQNLGKMLSAKFQKPQNLGDRDMKTPKNPRDSGFFYLRDRGFFVGSGIPTKSQLCLLPITRGRNFNNLSYRIQPKKSFNTNLSKQTLESAERLKAVFRTT